MSQRQIEHAHNSRLTQVYLSEIVSKARENFKVPAIAVSVMNIETVYLQEIQGGTSSCLLSLCEIEPG